MDIDALVEIDSTVPTRRIPGDDFTRNLYRAHIQATIERWTPGGYRVGLGDYQGDGTWEMIAYEPDSPADYARPITVGMPSPDDMPRVLTGRIRLASRDDRPVVVWEIAGQSNDGTYAPVINWDVEVPR